MTSRKRPTRANGERTKVKILDAAEKQFGARGYDAVSLRDITDEAKVTVALATYHFGTKENLFEAVVSRRAVVLGTERLERLTALKDPNVTDIIDAFISPLFQKAMSREPGWNDYFRVIARLAESNQWLDILQRNFDSVASKYIDALIKAVPHADQAAVQRGFSMMLPLMLSTVSKHERINRLSGGKVSAADLKLAYPALLRFVTAGIECLIGESAGEQR